MLVWLVIAGTAAYFARDLEDVLEVGARLRGTEATAVRHAISTHLPAGDAEYAILVARGLDPRSDTLGARQLDSLVAAVGAVTGVARVHAYRGPRDSLLVGTGGSLVLAALDPEGETGDRIIPKLREATRPLADAWAERGRRWL